MKNNVLTRYDAMLLFMWLKQKIQMASSKEGFADLLCILRQIIQQLLNSVLARLRQTTQLNLSLNNSSHHTRPRSIIVYYLAIPQLGFIFSVEQTCGKEDQIKGDFIINHH